MVSGRATAAAERPQAGSNNSAGMMVDSAWPAALASKLVAGQQQQGATTAMPTKTGLTPRRYLRALHAAGSEQEQSHADGSLTVTQRQGSGAHGSLPGRGLKVQW